jgi:hypothetical protein
MCNRKVLRLKVKKKSLQVKEGIVRVKANTLCIIDNIYGYFTKKNLEEFQMSQYSMSSMVNRYAYYSLYIDYLIFIGNNKR